ncbi:MAG TPA: BON domain-containing protein [Chloroflexota bacterium]|nr:BON domain-containing protein [Chloroflexota bacterium]
MAGTDVLKQWWLKALLGEEMSAHPVFDRNIEVKVDQDVVTLSGEVESAEEREQLEQEARSIGLIQSVVNRLKVQSGHRPERLQTVIAIFPDDRAAELASQMIAGWKLHGANVPDLVTDVEPAEKCLHELARKAELPIADVQPYIDHVREGKTLLIDRVPEEDAFRVISAFEGTEASGIHTLPPEPEPALMD